jgi:predicted RNase H-like HicB family nuclease
VSETTHLLSRPWTVSVSPESDDGGRYFVAAVAEIPGVNGYGASDVEAREDLYDALRDAIDAMVDQGEKVPAPPLWTGEMIEGAVPPPLDLGTVAVVPPEMFGHSRTVQPTDFEAPGRVEVGHAVMT